MALEIRYNKARSFENEAFRRIAKMLTKYFQEKKYDGLLIGNPIIDDYPKFRPDIMLYFNNGCIIFDLKDGLGNLSIPTSKDEFRKIPWKLDGRVVKAGYETNINPFNQLDLMQKKYFKCLKDNYPKYPTTISEITPPNNNTPDFLYYSNLVLFSGKITNINTIEIPYPYNRYFFISDEGSLLDRLEDISNNSKYSDDISKTVKSIFKADLYLIENSIILEEYHSNTNVDFSDSQNECLKRIKDFLAKKDEKIFIIKGKEKVGKTTLINEIKNIASELGIGQLETWAVTKRIANKLNRYHQDLDFISIYSAIYGGKPLLEVEIEDNIITPEDNSEELPFEPNEEAADVNPEIEKVSLKNSENELDPDSLVIIDEAQLLNSSSFSSDTLVFGSGKLLDDVITFLQLEKSNRKLILIGDPNQLSYGDQETSALSLNHIKNLIGVLPISVEILSRGKEENEIERNISWLADSIRAETFNNFKLINGNALVLLKEKSDWEELLMRYYQSKEPITVLTYTNESAFDSNNYIRSKLLQLPDEISKGDLLVMDNNIRIISEDPFEAPKYLSNGTSIEVIEVGTENSLEPIFVKQFKKHIVLKIREFVVKEIGSENPKKILSLENLRNSKTGKLSNEEFVALKILHNDLVKKTKKADEYLNSEIYKQLISDNKFIELKQEISKLELAVKNGERKKTELKFKINNLKKIEASYKKAFLQNIQSDLMKTHPLFQLANLRYAYALTVHKSLGEYFSTILLDGNMSENKGMNKGYFQWFYTGLSRATKKAYVLNSKNINPLLDVKVHEFADSVINNVELLPTERNSFKLIEATADYKSKYSSIKVSYDVLNMAFTLQSWLNLNSIESELDLSKVLNYYVLIKSKVDTSVIKFHFKGSGVPGKPTLDKAPYDLQLLFIKWLDEIAEIQNSTGNSEWRAPIYNIWKEELEKEGINWKHIETNGYQERIWLKKNSDFLIFDIWFDKAKFITTIKPFRANSSYIWDKLKPLLINS